MLLTVSSSLSIVGVVFIIAYVLFEAEKCHRLSSVAFIKSPGLTPSPNPLRSYCYFSESRKFSRKILVSRKRALVLYFCFLSSPPATCIPFPFRVCSPLPSRSLPTGNGSSSSLWPMYFLGSRGYCQTLETRCLHLHRRFALHKRTFSRLGTPVCPPPPDSPPAIARGLARGCVVSTPPRPRP